MLHQKFYYVNILTVYKYITLANLALLILVVRWWLLDVYSLLYFKNEQIWSQHRVSRLQDRGVLAPASSRSFFSREGLNVRSGPDGEKVDRHFGLKVF